MYPFNVFREAGLEVDLVSGTGTYQADLLSEQKDWLPDQNRAVREDHSSEFRSKLDRLLKPSNNNPSSVCLITLCPYYSRRLRATNGYFQINKYSLFFASASHASLIDYSDAKGLQSIAAKIYTPMALSQQCMECLSCMHMANSTYSAAMGVQFPRKLFIQPLANLLFRIAK